MTERKIYKMTRSNEKKITVELSEIPGLSKEFDSQKSKLGKRFGLKKRDHVAGLMAQTREYLQGCWQGKLDNASGLDYSEERSESAYNLGYYRGYNENTSGYLFDAINANPNFVHLA